MPFIAQGKTNIKYILIVVILAAIVGGGILAYQYWWAAKKETAPPEVVVPGDKSKTINWSAYTNKEYGFEFQYPKAYDTSEYIDCKVTDFEATNFIEFSDNEMNINLNVNIGLNIVLYVIDSDISNLEEYKDYYMESLCRQVKKEGGESCDWQIKAKESLKVGERDALKVTYMLRGPTAISDEENGSLTNPRVKILDIIKNSPAESAGLKIGDSIIEIKSKDDKLKISKVKEFQDFVDSHKGGGLTLTIQRGEDVFNVSLVPRVSIPGGEEQIGVSLARVAVTEREVLITFLFDNKRAFVLHFFKEDSSCDYKEESISEIGVYNKILSTFRFDGTADWQTYKSEVFQFKIKYPQDWVIEEDDTYPFGIILIPAEFQKDKRDMMLRIDPLNVRRESVFSDTYLNVIETVFAGKKAKIYSCPDNNPCPQQLSYAKNIHLEDYPINWGQKMRLTFL